MDGWMDGWYYQQQINKSKTPKSIAWHSPIIPRNTYSISRGVAPGGAPERERTERTEREKINFIPQHRNIATIDERNNH